MIACSCCKSDVGIGYREWNEADKKIELPSPPQDLEGSPICFPCYKDGSTMEQRIRVNICTSNNIVIMPNGMDGHICSICKEFWPYVEANQPNGTYICVKDR